MKGIEGVIFGFTNIMVVLLHPVFSIYRGIIPRQMLNTVQVGHINSFWFKEPLDGISVKVDAALTSSLDLSAFSNNKQICGSRRQQDEATFLYPRELSELCLLRSELNKFQSQTYFCSGTGTTGPVQRSEIGI